MENAEEVSNSGFKLKKKYEGLQPGVGKDPVNNQNLTDDVAIYILTNHPAGEGLFDEIPENWEELGGEGEPSFEDKVKAMKKAELVELAKTLKLDESGTVPQLKARIIEHGEPSEEETPTEE